MRYAILLSLIFVSFSCNYKNKAAKNDSLAGSWRLFDVVNINESDSHHADNLLMEANDKKILQQGFMLSLFEDGTYTEMKGPDSYNTGRWKYDEDKKTLTLKDSSKSTTFTLNRDNVNNKPVIGLVNKNSNLEFKYLQYLPPLKDYHEDPFYAANNVWRIKPAAPETNQQIQKRLSNYFKHLLYVLKSSKERKQQVVSFEFSQGIVKIYNGGIGINPIGIVPQTWLDTYYNFPDANIAYRMFEDYLMKSPSYKGAGTGNWIEDDYNILLNIYGDLEAGKFPAPLERKY